MWVVGPAVMQSGQVSGEGSNGVVMKRVEGDQKKRNLPFTECLILSLFYIINFRFIFGKINGDLWRIMCWEHGCITD